MNKIKRLKNKRIIKYNINKSLLNQEKEKEYLVAISLK